MMQSVRREYAPNPIEVLKHDFDGVMAGSVGYDFVWNGEEWGLDLSGSLQGAGGVGGLLAAQHIETGYGTCPYIPKKQRLKLKVIRFYCLTVISMFIISCADPLEKKAIAAQSLGYLAEIANGIKDVSFWPPEDYDEEGDFSIELGGDILSKLSGKVGGTIYISPEALAYAESKRIILIEDRDGDGVIHFEGAKIVVDGRAVVQLDADPYLVLRL